ncbi:two-component system sensor histidine kinase [Malaciobacter molluscorum LMG 25693]|uniref:histidine kinase n=2 Tax=Malaciobacter molluscorum LMG 25693 TaxID=870501 RepID=A0AB33GN69_9BACT|nr:HAMP domain-containing sensor histidine kinase [Malaciobacter molluscorum]AXX91074.1 two-component system sensor histidine kinase [Malaciobacter molluscorum LMG 25693]
MYDINIVLAYGVTFGILIMSILYTLVRYIYLKEFFYLAYCFMQIFSLGFIIIYSQLFGITDFYKDICIVFASFFAVAFAFGFFKGQILPSIDSKKELFLISSLTIFAIVIVFYHYMLFSYLPYTIIYLLLLLSVIFNIKEGIKSTLLHILAWSLVCLFLFILQIKSIYIKSGYVDLILIAFMLEAVLFTINLANKYKELKMANEDYENMLLQQTKLAKTGSMIGNIAHQYRQPLNNISYILINLRNKYEKDKLTKEFFYTKYNQIEEQLHFMSKTIDDFKEFYSPNKEKENFLLIDSINRAVNILQSLIKQYNVELNINFNTSEGTKVYGVANEFSQVILVLLKNAIEASKDEIKPTININISSKNGLIEIEIIDNGKGISKTTFSKLFKPYFSTKKEGFGIGLYMVKLIIEKSFNAEIKAYSLEKGMKFTIFLEKSF